LRSIEQPLLVCGVGLGAAIALDLLAGHPELVLGVVLIEPPLLAFSTEATAALSADRLALETALRDGDREAAVELYLSGRLEALGPGAGRLPAELADSGRRHPGSLFAELGAVPGWSIPLARLRAVERPTRIVVSESTPALVRDACDSVREHLAGSEIRELPGAGPAHLDAAAELAEVVLEIREPGAEPSP
jgi:pimeloyl-ACP methyl ester carboxylesterase